MDILEKKKIALSELRKGNLDGAKELYENIMKGIQVDTDPSQNKVFARICTNLASIHMKLGNVPTCEEWSNKAIGFDNSWMKGHFYSLICTSRSKRREDETIEIIDLVRALFVPEELKQTKMGIVGKTCQEILNDNIIRTKYYTNDLFIQKYQKELTYPSKVVVVSAEGGGHFKTLGELYSGHFFPRNVYARGAEKTSVILLEGEYDVHGLDWVCHDAQYYGVDPSKVVIARFKEMIVMEDRNNPFTEVWKDKFFHNMIAFSTPASAPSKKVLRAEIHNIHFKYNPGKRRIIGYDHNPIVWERNKRKEESIFQFLQNDKKTAIHVNFKNCIFESPKADVFTKAIPMKDARKELMKGDVDKHLSTVQIEDCLFRDCFKVELYGCRKVHFANCQFQNSTLRSLTVSCTRDIELEALDIDSFNSNGTTTGSSEGYFDKQNCVEVCQFKNLKITSCKMKGINGRAIFLNSEETEIADVVISNNYVETGLGMYRIGIHFEGSIRARICKNQFVENDVCISTSSSARLGCQIYENEFKKSNYGVFIVNDTPKYLDNLQIRNNKFVCTKCAEFRCPSLVFEEFAAKVMDKSAGNRCLYTNQSNEWKTPRVEVFKLGSKNEIGKLRKKLDKKNKKKFRKASSIYSDPGGFQGHVVCNTCDKPEPEGVKFKKCGQCKNAFYCSVVCQRKDWKTHKKYCQPNPRKKSGNKEK